MSKNERLKPILFSPPMVQAILAGRKSMTRRVIKGVSNVSYFSSLETNPDILYVDKHDEEYSKHTDGLFAEFEINDDYNDFMLFKSKYQIGDILWIREMFYQYGEWYGTEVPRYNHETCNYERRKKHTFRPSRSKDIYFTDNLPNYIDIISGFKSGRGYYKRPSIYMPKEVARIFLKVTDVRVERLQDITIKGMKEEGVVIENTPDFDMRERFTNLWDSINSKRDSGIYTWDMNPWVWVYEFERVEV